MKGLSGGGPPPYNPAAQPDGGKLPPPLKQWVDRAWDVLATVNDPEIPVISVLDLGIVRDVAALDGGGLRVTVTPTYSGCPATEVIARDIRTALEDAGLGPVELVTQRSPAWTTDWISDAGREKLRAYGIAPPPTTAPGCPVSSILSGLPDSVPCPRCGSANTERLAQFGSTPCKALYRCKDCAEPFDYFKPI